MSDRHLDSDRIAAYGERRLSANERAEVESHLAECDECRREASSVAIVVQRDRRRRRLILASPVALAAVVTLVVFAGSIGDAPSTDAGVLRPGRDSAREGVSFVVALEPAPGAVIAADALRFSWRAVAPDALYQLVVTDSAGQTVWEGRSADTTLALPSSVSLRSGARYIWLVDVLLPDGGIASTGPREFRVAP